MSILLGPFRFFSNIHGDIREWTFISGVNYTGDKLFAGVAAINPCHGFSVIAGVVETGDKFMAGDKDTGDNFIAGDNDAGDWLGYVTRPSPPASAAWAASTAWVVPLSLFLFSTILCTVYTYGVHSAQLFSMGKVTAIIISFISVAG